MDRTRDGGLTGGRHLFGSHSRGCSAPSTSTWEIAGRESSRGESRLHDRRRFWGQKIGEAGGGATSQQVDREDPPLRLPETAKKKKIRYPSEEIHPRPPSLHPERGRESNQSRVDDERKT